MRDQGTNSIYYIHVNINSDKFGTFQRRLIKSSQIYKVTLEEAYNVFYYLHWTHPRNKDHAPETGTRRLGEMERDALSRQVVADKGLHKATSRTATIVPCPHCQSPLTLVGDTAYRSGVCDNCIKASVWSDLVQGWVDIAPGKPDRVWSLCTRSVCHSRIDGSEQRQCDSCIFFLHCLERGVCWMCTPFPCRCD
jgi:hypothetical protein